MTLTPGARLGPYEVVALIGIGGMGEVYRARDTQLRRDVAIKVLPAIVADDQERLMRFEREAQTLAALNHPHIASIYGLERGGAAPALVMELVEGPTLSESISARALSEADVLRVARQIADALEAAHDKNIIHRDLKPANVKLTAAGEVKVLDFGLAKGTDTAHASASISNSPTLTARATQLGVILGTAAYMSPEQARGKVVDRRSDIWAFGCVVYELLAGRRAFDGEEVTDVLARLIERDPDWTALPARTRPEMRRLLERCLTKDPKARLRDIGEARIAIDDLIAGRSSSVSGIGPAPAATGRTASAARTSLSRLVPWGLVAVLAAILAMPLLNAPGAVDAPLLIRTELALPADVEFFSGPSISADGSKIAFVGVRQGIRQIYTRALNESETRLAPGTETASIVQLSADGRTIVFVTSDGWVKRMAVGTGIVEPLASEADLFTHPAVAADGSIAFSRGRTLMLRSPSGVERDLVAHSKTEDSTITWPAFGAGDTVLLYRSTRRTPTETTSRLEGISLSGGGPRVVIDGPAQAIFATQDRLVYEQDRSLFVADFDPAALAVRGSPMRLGESVSVAQTGGAAASIASTGALLLAAPTVLTSRLVWVTPTGAERILPGPPRGFQNPRVSPDGRLIAFSEGGTIWTLDPARGTFTRVSNTNESAVGFPAWSRDSSYIFYRSNSGIRQQRADGEGTQTVLPNTGLSDYPSTISPDGSTLVILRITSETAGDIYAVPTAGGDLRPVVVTKAYEGGPQLSPDGKWLLYVSNESGRMEVYLRPFGGPDRKWPVSGEGGLHPLWSHDGRRIFYRSGQQLLAVDVTISPEVRLGPPRVLFDRRYEFGPNLTFPNFSISRDGSEFLMVKEQSGGRHLNLMLNWFQSISARLR